ncbi:MAG: hypothetical protein O3B24_10795, partial [Verrucomicrobia bacterium]|nr:hypothetical protein [Verrucomicrobiota bacterium]
MMAKPEPCAISWSTCWRSAWGGHEAIRIDMQHVHAIGRDFVARQHAEPVCLQGGVVGGGGVDVVIRHHQKIVAGFGVHADDVLGRVGAIA